MDRKALERRVALREGVLFLCYHSIGTNLPDYPYRTSRESLWEQLSILSSLFEIVDLFEALDRLAQGNLGKNPIVVITFDDGYADNLDVATPVLEDHKAPATLFAPKDLICQGGRTHLSEAGLRDLSKHPLWTIGAHGVTHNVLPSFRAEDQRREMTACKEWLSDLTGKMPLSFAYPQGQFGETSVALARGIFSCALATDRRLGAAYDTHQIRRLCTTIHHENIDDFLRACIVAPMENGQA